jgi:phosphoglycolate phosphatase-like HAD superfamily hydrolase
MLDLKKYNQVIFDCDGVILDSNVVKSEAFSKSLIGEEDSLVDKFIKYHKNNGGISRFVKFEYYFKVLKKQENYQKELDETLTRYSKLSYDGLLNCEEILGVRSVLESLLVYDIECFVVSGGEQDEVKSVLEKRKMSNFFKAIYGSPITKIEHLENIGLGKALYFGDSWSDYIAARECNIDFIYIYGSSEWSDGLNFCKKNQIVTFKNFNNIIDYSAPTI